MTPKMALAAGIVSLGVASLVGCTRNEPGDMSIGGTESLDPVQSQSSRQQVVTGELDAIDLEARTFTVNAPDGEYHFSFTTATDVTGAAGPQGLANQTGARVTVYYESPSGQEPAGLIGETMLAMRIVLIEADPNDQR